MRNVCGMEWNGCGGGGAGEQRKWAVEWNGNETVIVILTSEATGGRFQYGRGRVDAQMVICRSSAADTIPSICIYFLSFFSPFFLRFYFRPGKRGEHGQFHGFIFIRMENVYDGGRVVNHGYMM